MRARWGLQRARGDLCLNAAAKEGKLVRRLRRAQGKPAGRGWEWGWGRPRCASGEGQHEELNTH